MLRNAKNTFNRIAARGYPGNNNHWQPYGALQNAIEPGVLAFTGKTDTTATRSTALVIAPTCVPGNCHKDKRGADLISNILPLDCVWYREPKAGLNLFFAYAYLRRCIRKAE